MRFTESTVEDAALEWLGTLGYDIEHGPEIAHGEPGAERVDEGYRDVVLDARLRGALERLNPHLPAEALEEAYRKLTRLDAPSLPERNRARASDAREWRDGGVPARWGAGTSRH
jgi:type I restriction enzyme, R subunit